MSLAACAGQPKPPVLPPPEPLVIAEELPDAPSADLLLCATRPEGFDEAAWGVLPEPVREKIVEIMKAFKDNADRYDRLVNRVEPGSCKVQ